MEFAYSGISISMQPLQYGNSKEDSDIEPHEQTSQRYTQWIGKTEG